MRLAALALLALGLVAACRPVVRACSSTDRCEGKTTCVGGRCELTTLPPAIADAERVVLSPAHQSYVALGGASALLVDFDVRGIALDRVVESHLLIRRPTPTTTRVAVHRLTGPWHGRSTSPADALALVGAQETESRLAPSSADLVRLQISSDSLHRKDGTTWAVQLDPTPSAGDGPALAEPSDDGPRLELYLRRTASPR